jgi:hypothetical protein
VWLELGLSAIRLLGLPNLRLIVLRLPGMREPGLPGLSLELTGLKTRIWDQGWEKGMRKIETLA